MNSTARNRASTGIYIHGKCDKAKLPRRHVCNRKDRVLAEWQRGTELDDVLFRVAATIAFSGLELDSEAFVARLKAERST